MEQVSIRRVAAKAYEIPTDAPEADGTLAWDRTTLVLVEIGGGNRIGLGYTYADASLATLIEAKIAALLVGRGALDIPRTVMALWQNVRNLGRPGLVATAISAVDVALWDLKAKLLGLPLAALLGQARDRIEIYGSGGFTS